MKTQITGFLSWLRYIALVFLVAVGLATVLATGGGGGGDGGGGGQGLAPGYWEFAMLHEILHTVGMVPTCAPNETLAGHVGDDPQDLMYAGPLPWNPSLLDVNNDDYFEHARGDGCLDFSKSAVLDPLPADAVLPPSWPFSSTSVAFRARSNLDADSSVISHDRIRSAVDNACSQVRVTSDQPDDIEGFQVHVMYVLPSDGVDNALDTNGTITTSVAVFNAWLAGQSGGRQVRLDTCGGELDVTFFHLQQTDAEMRNFDPFIRDEIEREIITAGFNEPNKLYAVYYDGSSDFACGGGAWPPILVGTVSALYLKGVGCNAFPTFTSPEGEVQIIDLNYQVTRFRP